MKKYIQLILVLMCFNSSFSQIKTITLDKESTTVNKLERGVYYMYPLDNANKFTGTWEYNNGGDKLTLKVKIVKTFFEKEDIYLDNLMTFLNFNNQNKLDVNKLESWTIGSSCIIKDNIDELRLDVIHNGRGGYMFLKLLDSTSLEVRPYNMGNLFNSYNLPRKLLLKKL